MNPEYFRALVARGYAGILSPLEQLELAIEADFYRSAAHHAEAWIHESMKCIEERERNDTHPRIIRSQRPGTYTDYKAMEIFSRQTEPSQEAASHEKGKAK